MRILQNRPDSRGDSTEKEAKAELGVTERTGKNRMKTTVRARGHFTSTPPSGQSPSLQSISGRALSDCIMLLTAPLRVSHRTKHVVDTQQTFKR